MDSTTDPNSIQNIPSKESTNPIVVSKEEKSHPIGTGLGAAMCGAGLGFASGFVGGPVVAAVGTVVGAVAGGWAGHAISERIESPGGKPIEMNPIRDKDFSV
jgi:outer membrane lipoprotein SlyB